MTNININWSCNSNGLCVRTYSKPLLCNYMYCLILHSPYTPYDNSYNVKIVGIAYDAKETHITKRLSWITLLNRSAFVRDQCKWVRVEPHQNFQLVEALHVPRPLLLPVPGACWLCRDARTWQQPWETQLHRNNQNRLLTAECQQFWIFVLYKEHTNALVTCI